MMTFLLESNKHRHGKVFDFDSLVSPRDPQLLECSEKAHKTRCGGDERNVKNETVLWDSVRQRQ
jgi:hypothetical protein